MDPRAIHCLRMGRKGKGRKDVTIVDPTPDAWSPVRPDGGAGVGIQLNAIRLIAGCRHDLRQVLGIREKGNYSVDREPDPFARIEGGQAWMPATSDFGQIRRFWGAEGPVQSP
jgi:hypothetical protein